MVFVTKSIRPFYLGLIFLMSALHGQEVSFQSVGAMRLRSFGIDANSGNVVAKEAGDVKAALTLSMDDNEARRLAYKLYSEYEKKYGIEPLSDDQSLKKLLEDLEIFFCKGDSHELTVYNASVGRHITTMFGDASCVKMLSKTLVNTAELEGRQNFIKELVSNKNLFDDMESLLQELKRSQHELLSFWVPDGKLTQDLVKQLYFSWPGFKTLNDSALGLEVGTRLGNAKTAFLLTSDIIAMTLGSYFVAKVKSLFNSSIQPISFLATLKDTFNYFCNPVSLVYKWQNLKNPDFQASLRQAVRQDLINSLTAEPKSELVEKKYAEVLQAHKNQIFIEGFLKVYMTFMRIYNAKMLLGLERQKNDTACFMQDRLMGVASYVRAAQEICALAARNHLVADGLFTLTQAKHLLNGHGPVNDLVNILSTRTFKGASSFFSLTGRVLEAYKLMGEVKDELVPCMVLLGELDACVAIAKLYKEFESRRVHYTWATYEQANRPHMYALNFWNTMVDFQKVVVNTIELGRPGAESAEVVTGSNTGGKSTALKGIDIAAFFAQTLTIVPADRYTCTPFGLLGTAMNIADDTARGKSHYQSEVDRADMLSNYINDLNESKFGFVGVDELFTGASADENARSEYKVIHRWATNKYLCFIAATHFKDVLTQLESVTQGAVKNYKIDAIKVEGVINRPFKLEPGISDCNIAGDILNAQMADLHININDLELN